jgi:hypothetical protein
MALTISITPHAEFDTVTDVSSITFQHANLVLDSSYPNGGYPITPSRFGFSTRIVDIVASAVAIGKSSFGTNYDPLNKTLRVFTLPAGAGRWYEVTATTNLAGLVVKVIAIGY